MVYIVDAPRLCKRSVQEALEIVEELGKALKGIKSLFLTSCNGRKIWVQSTMLFTFNIVQIYRNSLSFFISKYVYVLISKSGKLNYDIIRE